jgi:bicarbonate transport system substrate-binding protein
MSHLPRSTRRHFLSLMGATATSSIFLKGCLGNPPSDSPTAPVNTVVSADQPKPETTKIKLGYIPIVESAPIIIAQEKRFFAKHGMWKFPNRRVGERHGTMW